MSGHVSGMPCCNSHDALMERTRQESTASLVSCMAMLDSTIPTIKVQADRDAHIRARVAVYDVLTERHDLEALLDSIYQDEGYAGTYTDAVLAALEAKGIPGKHGWLEWA